MFMRRRCSRFFNSPTMFQLCVYVGSQRLPGGEVGVLVYEAALQPFGWPAAGGVPQANIKILNPSCCEYCCFIYGAAARAELSTDPRVLSKLCIEKFSLFHKVRPSDLCKHMFLYLI